MGWGSTLMQNETSFLKLNGAYVPPALTSNEHIADPHRMTAIAVSLLTMAYPGLWFPPMRRNKKHTLPTTQEESCKADQVRRVGVSADIFGLEPPMLLGVASRQ